MSNITNYSYLIQSMFGGKGTSWGTGGTLPGVFQFSQLNSSSIQAQLKAAGIDTNSKQYKAVIQQMTKSGCTGSMYTNVQAIKNLMKNYDKDGDYIDPTTGLAGLLLTKRWKQIYTNPAISYQRGLTGRFDVSWEMDFKLLSTRRENYAYQWKFL